MNRARPVGPYGGGWTVISNPEMPSNTATETGAPAWR